MYALHYQKTRAPYLFRAYSLCVQNDPHTLLSRLGMVVTYWYRKRSHPL